MRIIAGKARAHTIHAPEGLDTRPTLDRVRENLFNILQRRVPDARVLDLFAGSGALSLQAISRGASSAVLVDHDRTAIRCIEKNIADVRFGSQMKVLNCDWREAVRRLQNERFDLVFLDPPYAMTDLSEVTAALMPLLDEEAMIVIEHKATTMPRVCDGLMLTDTRRYGIAGICFFQPVARGEQA